MCPHLRCPAATEVCQKLFKSLAVVWGEMRGVEECPLPSLRVSGGGEHVGPFPSDVFRSPQPAYQSPTFPCTND